jgi:DNA-binding beta-propeller fold protein YncE
LTYVPQGLIGGPGSTQFNGTTGIAIDPLSQTIVVADDGNHRVQLLDRTGRYRRGRRDANGDAQHFSSPDGVAIDPLSGRTYVVDGFGADRVYIFDSTGAYVRQFGGYGGEPGTFILAAAIAIDDATREVLVGDAQRVQVFDAEGAFKRQWGGYGSGPGQFSQISGIAIDAASRHVIVGDSSGRIQAFDAAGGYLFETGNTCITKPCGYGRFDYLTGVAVDPASGNIFATDSGNSRIQMFDRNGHFLGQFGSLGNGPGQFDSPHSIVSDAMGNLLVGDRSRIQTFRPDGTQVQSIGTLTYDRVFGAEAWTTVAGLVREPTGLAVNAVDGSIVVADHGNARLQVFDAEGRFVKIIGGSGTGDGRFMEPWAVAIDVATQDIVVADVYTGRIQVFDRNGGFVRSFASQAVDPVRTSYPFGVAVDPMTSEIVVSDGRITIYSPDGKVVRQFGSPCDVVACSPNDYWGIASVAIDPVTRNVIAFYSQGILVFDTSGALLRRFGSQCSTPTCDGQFYGDMGGVAVDPSTGVIFAVDALGLQAFDKDGRFLGRFDAKGSGFGAMWNPKGVARDPRTGRIVVADFNNNRLVSFVRVDESARTVVEYFNADLDQYFITADTDEQAMVDTGAVGRWTRTGQSFESLGPTPACRFYGNLPFGPNSHFYTAIPAECATLKSIFDSTAASWKFESSDFMTTLPDSASGCPTPMVPVYRAFNNERCPVTGECSTPPNHRLTTSQGAIAEVVAKGWVFEGTVMCATR